MPHVPRLPQETGHPRPVESGAACDVATVANVSFDLYFVDRPGQAEGWGDVMQRLEEAAAEQREPTSADRSLWDEVTQAVLTVLPEAEVLEADRSRQVDDGAVVLLSMFPGEISINTPYWFEGEQAEKAVDRLKAVAAAIEEATGLVAYDPQSDGAFLESGAAEAPATFDRIHDFMANELGVQPASTARRPWWAFWRR